MVVQKYKEIEYVCSIQSEKYFFQKMVAKTILRKKHILLIYGMNFSATDPLTGKTLPHNMPELRRPNGYLYTLLVIAIIAVIQLIIFWKKGWFDKMK